MYGTSRAEFRRRIVCLTAESAEIAFLLVAGDRVDTRISEMELRADRRIAGRALSGARILGVMATQPARLLRGVDGPIDLGDKVGVGGQRDRRRTLRLHRAPRTAGGARPRRRH